MNESEILELKKSTSELKEAVISIVAILNKVGSTASAHYELKSSAKFGKVRQNGGKEV